MTQWGHDILLGERPVSRPAIAEGRVAFHIIVLAICLVALSGALILTPGADGLTIFGYRWPLTCRLYETFGIRCALCGMSRSFSSLAHGDWAAGWRFHRIGPALFALFCLEIPYRLYRLATQPRRARDALGRVHAASVVGAALALFINWLVYLGGLTR